MSEHCFASAPLSAGSCVAMPRSSLKSNNVTEYCRSSQKPRSAKCLDTFARCEPAPHNQPTGPSFHNRSAPDHGYANRMQIARSRQIADADLCGVCCVRPVHRCARPNIPGTAAIFFVKTGGAGLRPYRSAVKSETPAGGTAGVAHYSVVIGAPARPPCLTRWPGKENGEPAELGPDQLA